MAGFVAEKVHRAAREDGLHRPASSLLTGHWERGTEASRRPACEAPPLTKPSCRRTGSLRTARNTGMPECFGGLSPKMTFLGAETGLFCVEGTWEELCGPAGERRALKKRAARARSSRFRTRATDSSRQAVPLPRPVSPVVQAGGDRTKGRCPAFANAGSPPAPTAITSSFVGLVSFL